MQNALKDVLPQAIFGPIVTVDRTVDLRYPDYIKNLVYPELDAEGPESFSLGDLEAWLHVKQCEGLLSGDALFVHMRHAEMFPQCLGFRHLSALAKIDPQVYFRWFGHHVVYGWRSVAVDRYGMHAVPYIASVREGLRLTWRRLEFDWDVHQPALLFKKGHRSA